MNDFPPSMRHDPQPVLPPHRTSEDSDAAEQRVVYGDVGGGEILTSAPKERFRLGYFDVMCLVVNRMIGTGIFNSPQRVMKGTRSTGVALLFWCAGIIYCLAGTHVFIEYGLNIPRYTIRGTEMGVPRSGGDLNYLQYVYRKPAYRRGTVLLITCLFGVGFIALGNMAGNSISFAVRVLLAAGIEEPNNGAVRGIAIAIAGLTCFIHTFSRRGGIWLNNVLAIIKILMLLLIVATAIAVGAGGLKNTPNVVADNTAADKSFQGASKDANSYAHAFLAIIFSFSGFEQPNYVLGEIARPRRKFPIAMAFAICLVSVLYMAVNISYMVVVPKDEQITAQGGVAERFFELSLGSLSSSSSSGHRIFNAFLAISSLGNIIVMTYTAARVKQEIAKEGILPWPAFFAQNTDLSLGRALRWFQKRGMLSGLLRIRWFSPEEHMEKTPVGAFVLHMASCLILIFATWGLAPHKAYELLTSLSAYVINCFFGTLLGLGILILRLRGPPPTPGDGDSGDNSPSRDQTRTWKDMTGPYINPTVSVVCAVIFTVGNLWPVVTTWIKPSAELPSAMPWWWVPTISWVIIGLGVVWFLGFVGMASHVNRKYHKVFLVEKQPEFESADGGEAVSSSTSTGRRSSNAAADKEAAGGQRRHGAGGLVLVHETVYLSWVGKETLRARRTERHDELREDEVANPYQGTDFDAYFQNQQDR